MVDPGHVTQALSPIKASRQKLGGSKANGDELVPAALCVPVVPLVHFMRNCLRGEPSRRLPGSTQEDPGQESNKCP